MKLQFGLRTLMIVVTLLAMPLGYVGWQAKIVRERAAMRLWMANHESLDPKPVLWNGEPAPESPSWLRSLMGDDAGPWYFRPRQPLDRREAEEINRVFPATKIIAIYSL